MAFSHGSRPTMKWEKTSIYFMSKRWNPNGIRILGLRAQPEPSMEAPYLGIVTPHHGAHPPTPPGPTGHLLPSPRLAGLWPQRGAHCAAAPWWRPSLNSPGLEYEYVFWGKYGKLLMENYIFMVDRLETIGIMMEKYGNIVRNMGNILETYGEIRYGKI